MEKDDEVMLVDDDEDNLDLQTIKNATQAAAKNFNEPASIELSTVSKDSVPDDKPKGEEMAQITITNKANKGNDLDKFKRRLIRAIAHLILKDNCLTEEIWDDLKKQTGCDCKLLWDRMRALTIKKLRRLFTAEDIVGNITNIARLSVTDWLLFDLVLVHEKIDFIGQDITTELKEHPKILRDLFRIVVQYDIEVLDGDALTKAWFEATKKYNGSTRKCSPMLLQRRWYQLKEAVRDKFYQFWFNYRGNERELANANQFKPNDLDMEIVKQYRYIATKPFPTWEELIAAKKVSLPEDFERLQLAKIKIFRNENEPDLEVIEPEVETIDLELESDSEVSRDSTSVREMSDDGNNKDTTNLSNQNTATTDSRIDVKIVKTETIAEISDEDDVHILESTHSPAESEKNYEICDEDDNENEECEIPTPNELHNDITMFKANEDILNKDYPSSSTSIKIENVISKVDRGDDEIKMIMPKIIASMSIENSKDNIESVMPKIANVSSTAIPADEPDPVNNEVECILETVAENIKINKFYNILKQDGMLPLQDNLKNHDVLVKQIKDEVGYETEVEKLESLNTVPSDVNIFDGIELEDDGIAYVEDDDPTKEELNTEIKVEDPESNDNTPTIDLKLLLTPVVYTKKLDDMDVFRFIDYDMVKDKRVIENADHESKPVDKDSVKMEEISQQRGSSPDNDIISESESENNSEVDDGPEVISCSSWLLNKPRNLSFNPILLCKNPDFNTRLKRLSAGFFISARNRDLLKECKPLTIDLHKAFENKLTDNTLYLKDTELLQKIKVGGENVEENDIENEDEIINITETELKSESINQSTTFSVTDSHPAERNKVINLPNIDQVRRLNERLLVAEVTPIQVTNTIKPPVNVVQPKSETTIQNIHNLGNIKIDEKIMTSTENKKSDAVKMPKFGMNEKCILSNVKSSKTINVKRIASTIQKEFIQSKHQQKKPRVYVEVPWNRRTPCTPNKLLIPKDRLLASDTVAKILSVCGGYADKWPQYKSFKKAMKRSLKEKGVNNDFSGTQNKIIIHPENEINEVVTDNDLSFVGENVTIESQPKLTQVNPEEQQVVNQRKNSNSKTIKMRKNIHKNEKKDLCCWARERILYLKTNRRCKPHRCPQPLCQCCCRQELVKSILKTGKQDEELAGNSTIELEVLPAQPVTEIIPSEKNNERVTEIIPFEKCNEQVTEIIPSKKYNEQVTEIIPSEKNNENVIEMIPSEKINKQVTTSPVINPVKSDQELISNQMTVKVSVGINTDYDKDFETSFAARFLELKSTQTGIHQESHLTDSLQEPYVSIKHNVSHQTQTSVNMTNTQGSIVSNLQNSLSTINSNEYTNNIKKKYSPIKPKCKIHSAESYINYKKIAPKGNFSQTCREPTLHSDNGKVLLQERSEKMDKVLFVTNDKIKHNYYQSPICLGKNKILLCSFKKPSLKNLIEVLQRDDNNGSENTQPQVSLPVGVQIVLLPNKELALSIDPGIELDPSELAKLPALMQSIQQQLSDSDFFNENESHLNNQNINTNENCNKIETNLVQKEEKENEIAETISSVPEDQLSPTKDILDSKRAGIPGNESTNTDVNDLDDTSTLHKKTILSDLMEMSGISAEDIPIKNIDIPNKEQSELIHHSTSELEELQTKPAIPVNEKTLNNIFSENHIVQTALSRYPELSIVYSYQELKYASENNAQFFKMDIETGVIIPINLCIKKQIQSVKSKPPFTWSKSVIDLTDEPDDDDIHQVPIRIADIETSHSERSILKILEEKKKEAVPVKLFSAVRPSILHNRRSLLLNSVKSGDKIAPRPRCKKRIRIIKIRKRKLPTETVTSIELDSDTEMKDDNSAKIDMTLEKTRADDEFDSDDEPLALIAKRKKESSNSINETYLATNAESQKVNEDNEHTEIVNEETHTDNINTTDNKTPECITEEVYIASIPQADPVPLEPLRFEDNNPESSEEDCILGV